MELWGTTDTKEILERQADQVTDLQKSGGLESSLPIEIQNERASFCGEEGHENLYWTYSFNFI